MRSLSKTKTPHSLSIVRKMGLEPLIKRENPCKIKAFRATIKKGTKKGTI